MSNRPYQIAVIVKAVNSDFWQTLLLGSIAAMKEQPELVRVTTYGPPDESDVQEQVEILEKVVSEKPDAIVIASTSNDLTIPAIDRAMSAGIPVITVDNLISSDNYTAFLATDNGNAAAAAADAMLADWKRVGVNPDGKKFVVINSSRVSQVDQARDKGFIDRMKELVPSIQMLDIQYVENSAELTAQVIRQLIGEHPDLIGVFADNDQTGIGISNGIQSAGAAGKVIAYAFDSNDTEIQAVKDGILNGMVVQDPFGMGYKGVGYAVDALQGRGVPKSVDTGATIVTIGNLENPSIQKLLYPNR